MAGLGRWLLSGLALALMPGPRAHGADWSFVLAPYAWGAGLDGQVRHAGLPPVASRRGGSDALSSLDWAAMASLQARRDRLVMFADVLHVQLSESGTVPLAGVPARMRVRASTALLAGGYRLLEGPAGHLDLLAGVRAWQLSSRVAIGAPIDRGASAGVGWLDPQLGLKARWSPGGRWFLSGWLLVDPDGGEADLMAAVGREVGERTAVHLGYRHVSMKRRSTRFSVDADVAGPGLGVEYRF
ncbi:MAG: hypothetical protein KF823_02465 [Xanthomonadales bacterium]|nr:hypothetical protein [Xanthomonadales bacterium]